MLQILIALLAGAILFCVAMSAAAADIEARKLVIIEGKGNTPPEHKVVDIFTKRVVKRSDVTVETIDEESAKKPGGLKRYDAAILIGQPSHNSLVRHALLSSGVRAPEGNYPGPEGFVLHTIKNGVDGITKRMPVIVASGVDDRGTVYAMGRLLREARYMPDSVIIPDLTIVDKPAFEYRGLGISHMDPRQAQRTGASGEFDGYHYTEDQMIFGFNTFLVGNGTVSVSRLNEEGYLERMGAQSEIIDEYGLLYLKQYAPNGISRDDWKEGFKGRVMACPSVPEAREIMLKGREALYRSSKRIDVLLLVSGDVAGCHCEDCLPWVKTYVELCEEIAEIYHRYFPDGKVWLTTQELDFDETQWLWDYLNEKPRPWIDAISYAPSGDELSPYLTGRINYKYEKYMGMGRRSRYLREVLKQVPRTIEVTSFPDISHWVSSQYALPEVAPEMAAVHERRTFNVRPRQMYDIFKETAGLTIGTTAYCEGIFDDVNKAVWTQLHWNPDLTVEEILEDYYRWYCGPEAAPELVEAAFQLEENMQSQVLENGEGFERFLSLVRSAGEKIPPRFRKDNWRYLMLLEKGLTDLYVYHKVNEGTRRLATVNELLLQAKKSHDPKPLLTKALGVLEQEPETSEMIKVREEAKAVDDELDAAAGYRFIALINMVERDLVGLQWTADRIREMLETEDIEVMKESADALARYGDPGPGGYYDNCGHLAQQPHLAFGTSNYWSVPLVPGSRPSQVLINYSFRGEKGVSYEYSELDPKAQYLVKMTFARPKRAWFIREVVQSIHVDGQDISGPISLEPGTVSQMEYDIPRSATADGRLTIEFVPASEQSLTLVSEIWLMKK